MKLGEPLWDGTPEGGAAVRSALTAALAAEARGVLGVFRPAALARRLGRTEAWTLAALRCFRFAEPHAPSGCWSATWRLTAKGRAEIEAGDDAPRAAGGSGAVPGAGDGADVPRGARADAPRAGAAPGGCPGAPGGRTGVQKPDFGGGA